ncbi:MAG: 16S rRNA (uracil(1498)-N(3))-methyltransferase [Verrucomicrobiota bacterium]
MNIALLKTENFINSDTAVLKGRQHDHIRDILKLSPGDFLETGILNGNRWQAEIIETRPEKTVIRLAEKHHTAARPTTDIILAMVRPRIARQVLVALASLGVKRIMFVNAWKVPKPYFSQRLFDKDEYMEYLYLGLEQSGLTWLPQVTIHKRFTRFAEEEIELLLPADNRRIVAHPEGNKVSETTERTPDGSTTLAIGPEGGWTDGEVEMLEAKGFKKISLGERILRVETAIPYLFGRLGL